MRVLLLNASPKADGATQEMLIIARNALPAGAESELVCLGDANVGFCLGDRSCYKTCQCVQNDGMNTLMDKLDAADALIIAAPSYWGDVPGQFKAFIDRCTPYSNTNPNPARRRLSPGKRCYGIALRTGTHKEECEHLLATISHMCGHLGVDMAGAVYFTRVASRQDVPAHEAEIRNKVAEWFAFSQD